MGREYCKICEGRSSLNHAGLCGGCQEDTDEADRLNMNFDEYKRATYEGGKSPQWSHTEAHAAWAFKTKDEAEQVRASMLNGSVSVLGVSVHGYPDPDTYEALDAEGFDVSEGAFTLTKTKTKGGAFWVLAWKTMPGHFAQVVKDTLNPDHADGEQLQMYFSPASLYDLEDEDGQALDVTSYDPKTGKEEEDPFDWGSRAVSGDVCAADLPADPAPEAKPDVRGALDALVEAHGWPEVLAALALEAQDQAGDMGAHMDTAKEDEGKADRLAADLTALAAWVNGVKP